MRLLAAKVRNWPLRLVLVVPFILQIFAAVGLTGWISLRNGQEAVNNVTTQLRNEISNRIIQHLNYYLDTPNLVNYSIINAIDLDFLSIHDLPSMNRYFYKQIQLFKTVGYIQFGSERGEFIGVERVNNNSFNLEIITQKTGNNLHTYVADDQGKITKQLLRVTPNYDPRKRPWYMAPKQANKPAWSRIYTYVNNPKLAITLGIPVYENGKLIGVVATDLVLSEISSFLRGLKIGKSGQTFIIERSGLLVASSTPEKPFLTNPKNQQPQRLPALESKNAITKGTTQYLLQYFGNLTQIDRPQQLDFEIAGQRQFLQIIPFKDNQGLDWLIVVVVPEADFMEQIEANTRTTILLCVGSLGAATILGIFTSRWISQPILRLSQASQAISSGNLDQQVQVQGIAELGILATSFNQMATQLKAAFKDLEQTNSELEQRVENRTLELKEAKEAADAANWAKSNFLANMSHELRTPLNGILGYAQILQKQTNLTAQQRHSTHIIHQCGNHLLTLINDILDLAKIEACKMELHPTIFHFYTFLNAITEICSVKAEQKGIAFICQFSASLPIGVEADEKRLRQVLLNLLNNAIKFTDEGSVIFKVEIVASEIIASSPNSAQTLDKIRFKIEDTGVGMTPAQLQKIFQPFEQVCSTQKMAEGTGLGLSISANIAARMGSQIQVMSQMGVGSQFWFDVDLPASNDWEIFPKVELQEMVVGFTGTQRKVLVVDDQPANRSVILHLLQPLGFEVMEAVNGKAALEQMLQIKPDIIITDLVMPVMDGFEFLRHLRSMASLKDIVVIASSASVFEADQYKSLEAGANAFLPKPVQASELFNLLQQYLEISWIYQETHPTVSLLEMEAKYPQDATLASEAAMIVPSHEALEKLYDLIMKGNLKGIMKQVEQLKQLDEKLTPFAEKVCELANGFHEKQLHLFISQYKQKSD